MMNIKEIKEECSIHNVKFAITVPHRVRTAFELMQHDSIKTVVAMLDKYKIAYNSVDTISGSYCLNQEYIEFKKPVKGYVSYDYAYIDGWSIEDFEIFNNLVEKEKIIVNVSWYYQDGSYKADNH